MSWQNAPLLNKLTATQLGGERGAQLWGVDYKGTLYSTYQTKRGSDWSEWRGPGWYTKNYPAQVYELAAAQLDDGRSQLWVLDMKRQLWTITQASAGGEWNDWQGPNWNKPPGNEKLKKLTAAHVTGGTKLWGILDDGMLITCNMSNSGPSQWDSFPKTSEGLPWVEVAACRQGYQGGGAIWGIDSESKLWGNGQDPGTGRWGDWGKPNWKRAPKCRNIAAVELGGTRGATIWAIRDDYKVVYNYQTQTGMDSWMGWVDADDGGTLSAYEITAAAQNDSLGRVWAISLGQLLTSQATVRPTLEWERRWTPPVG